MLTKLDLIQIKKIIQGEAHQELAPVKRDIKKLQKSMNEILGVLDEEDVRLRKRVEKIEDHLGLASV